MNWSSPSLLATPNTLIDYVPSATRDTQGRIWVFWEGERVWPTIREDIYYKVQCDTCQSGWSNHTLTGDAAQDITPTAVGLQDGRIFAVWASKRATNYDLYSVTITNGVRSGESQLTTGQTDDWGPAVVQGHDNRIWVFWNKYVNNGFDIYYRAYDGTSWSAEQALITNPDVDLTPTAVVNKNGDIWVAWASYRTNKYEIFAKVYDGSVWSPDRQMTSSGSDNQSPGVLQDSDGTLWLFWNRVLNAAGGRVQAEIYYKTSQDNGVSWSATETPLTSTPDFSENDPSVVQGTDHRLWLFFSGGAVAGDGTFELFYTTSEPILTHDIAVKNVKASPEKLRYNSSALIEVTLANLGDFSESLELRVYMNSTLMFTQSISLAPLEARITSFLFQSLGTTPGRYLLYASVTPVPGETLVNQADNSSGGGALLHTLPPGDTNQDGDVDILDAGTVVLAFTSVPGASNWNSEADVDSDADVDIVDVAITLLWFDTVT